MKPSVTSRDANDASALPAIRLKKGKTSHRNRNRISNASSMHSRKEIRRVLSSLLRMKRLQFIFSLLATLVIARASFAQSDLERQYTILAVTVEGNQSGSAETIISQSGLFKGQKITLPSDDLRRAMSRLWQQNIFSDVSIDVAKVSPQSDGTDGLYLVIRVIELQRLDTIMYEGNEEVSRADI